MPLATTRSGRGSPARPAASRARRLGALVAVALGLVVGATPAPGSQQARLSVVASFYPLAEWAAVVGAGRVVVRNLTPAGTEPHDLEPTPADLRQLRQADVVLTLGAGFQPAVDDALAAPAGGQVRLAAAEGLPLRSGSGPDHAHDRRAGPDLHVWLDPVLAARIVTAIGAALAEADPAGKPVYEANANAYVARLDRLHQRYTRTLATCRRREMVTSHAAFGYLAARYGLEQIPISGLSPEAEPTPRRLAEVVDFVEAHDVEYIFFETLASPRVAETIARETGARTLPLNPLEGLTRAEQAAGMDYIAIMEANLRNLAVGLGCQAP